MADAEAKEERVVLPSDIIPKAYDLELQTNFEDFTFYGICTIQCEVQKPTAKIVVNQEELIFSEVKIKKGAREETVNCFEVDSKKQTVSITLDAPLQKGLVTLTYKFKGFINNKMKGFYRSKYKQEDGETAWIGTTQFEATSARLAFPCFDEPSLKATFDITIVYPEKYQCLCNMPEKPKAEDMGIIPQGYTKSSFETTPVMSTYLVAWCIGNFEMIEAKTSDQSTLCRVFTTPGKIAEGKFALDAGVKAVEFYEQYFGIAYPLPKLDQIGIPDFDAGAMENWGLVTYRLSMFLASDETSTSTKTVVLTTVTHELAHMWFGNLVSPEWWSQLWLKEGFACYLQYLCAQAIRPEWNFWKRFVEDEMVYALRVDGMANSHPIEVPVANADQIDEIFDGISYCKGACVIRMMVNFLGEEQVKQGLNKYLTAFSYRNAVTEDLWEYLSTDDIDVKNVMDEWTKSQGYPYLQISRLSATKFQVEQHRFLSSGKVSDAEDATIWTIPMEIAVEDRDETIRLLINQRKQEIDIPDISEETFVKFNTEFSGFYICQYDDKMTAQLSKNIFKLSTMDRFSLVNDSYMLMKGYLSAANVLELISGFVDETDYSVWEKIDSTLTDIGTIIRGDDDLRQKFDDYCIKLYKPLFEKLGWENEEGDSYETKLLRALIIRGLGASKYGPVKDKAQEMFRNFLLKGEPIHPDLRNAIFLIGSKFGTTEDFEALLKFYKETDVEDDKERALRRLGSFPDESLIKRALEISMSDDVRRQDCGRVIVACGRNKLGADITWDTFLKPRWDALFKETSGGSLMGWIILAMGGVLGNEYAEKIETFFETHKRGSADRAIKQVCEKIRNQTAWRDRDLKAIKAWFD